MSNISEKISFVNTKEDELNNVYKIFNDNNKLSDKLIAQQENQQDSRDKE